VTSRSNQSRNSKRRHRDGGAIYAHLRAADVGLSIHPGQVNDLISIGREVKWLLNDSVHAQQPQ
jgi:proline racemase